VYTSLRLGSAFDDALLAHGGLWVTTTSGPTSWLWRLDPKSLAVLSRRVLPGSGPNDGRPGAIALAGGSLWVGNSDRLDRVALPSGEIAARVPVPGAEGVDVAANPTGTILVISEGHERAYLQRRNPRSGALIAASAAFDGVTKPYIGGIIDGGVWLSESTGNMGYVQRLSARTLKATTPNSGEPLRIATTNGVEARVFDQILWVTQIGGGPKRNYCGDPVTGRSRAPLPFPPVRVGTELLAVSTTSIYYLAYYFRPKGAELVRAPINQRCHQ
jgi:hypothetical protein